jgi:hypothetical protein
MVISTSWYDDFTDDENDFVFGLDFSKLDVSQVEFDETISNGNTDRNAGTNDVHDDTFAILKRTTEQQQQQQLFIQLFQLKWTNIYQLNPVFDIKNDGTSCNNNVHELFQRAEGMGAKLGILKCCCDAFGGRGLSLNLESIAAGSVVAILPRSLRIGQNYACRRLGLPSKTPDLTALSLLLVSSWCVDRQTLQSSKDNNIDQVLAMYVKCLPRLCQNAVFMTQAEQDYWGQSAKVYLKNIRNVQDQAHCSLQYIQDCLLSADVNTDSFLCAPMESVILWAISMVQSRTHSFGSHKSRWLTPIFDFCNHSTDPNCRLEGDSHGNLILRANKTIQNDNEITIDYQVSDDAKLVATYGFSLLYPSFGSTVSVPDRKRLSQQDEKS